MSILSKDQMLAILKEYNVKPAEDINHALKDLFGGLLQEAPEAVLDTELGCEKNGQRPEGTGNRRNGHTEKSVRTEHGELELAVPRDRTREFHPLIVKKRHKEITASFNIKMGKRFPAFGISACLIL